jgi:hypothetical protein
MHRTASKTARPTNHTARPTASNIAPAVMDQWLDSLSEDWISQPRSPHSSPLIQSQTSRDSPSPPSNNGSQSRIPRYKPRTASGLSAASGKESVQTSSIRRTSGAALKEKSSSNINASHKRIPNGQLKAQGLNAASMRLRGRQVSSGSVGTGQQDTVQHRSSPIKGVDGRGTPDWKRRVLKENTGKGDLFSPIGLEGMFKPPAVNGKGRKPVGAGKTKLFPTGEFGSSPPPYSAKTESGNEMNPAGPSLVARTENLRSRSIPRVPESPSLLPHGNRPQTTVDQTNSPTSSDVVGHSDAGDKTRNEHTSPVYISRQDTVDGRVEFGAIDMSVRRLQSEMAKLRMQQQNLPSSRSSDHGIDYTDSRLDERSLLHEKMDEVTSQSLPDDLSMGTDAFAANGGFVSVHRGGYSNDGSFQRRPVSPSLLPDPDGTSLKLPSSTLNCGITSRETSESFAQTKSKTPSSPPETPNRRSRNHSSRDERPTSSGSPLKLFDKYDTFTNDRLVRRLSKFEATLNQEIQEDFELGSDGLPSTPSPGPKVSRRRSQRQHSQINSRDRRISSFGDGELDDYHFPAYDPPAAQYPPEQAQTVHEHDQLSEYEHNREIFRFERSPSHESAGSLPRRVLNSKPRGRHVSNDQKQIHVQDDRHEGRMRYNEEYREEYRYDRHEEPQKATGKRLPYSSVKDPAPKRRRTLRSSNETDQEFAGVNQNMEAQAAPVQSVLGRKRKDARYDNEHEAADPNIIASRQILRPKAPTLNRGTNARRRNDAADSTIAHEHSGKEYEEPVHASQKSQIDQAIVDPPTRIVAGALATVALNTAQEITGGSRKASVTTADFFNEAQQVMQMIRAKGRPRSSHTTAETSEIGHPTIMEESFVEDSTKDQFSRPPSREGGNSPKLGVLAEMDPRVVSHLRKYEDKEGLGLALSSSLKNLQISHSRRESAPDFEERQDDEYHDRGTESDPPNIRIRESAVPAHQRKDSSSTQDALSFEIQRQHNSHGSQSTSGQSTSRSNPTGSSHSSTNRMVIAPETVAHLLSDQMAGMAYDHQRNVWVKRKSTPKIGGMENVDHTASEGTEEDLFGDIPDLSVDEMEELQRVKDAVSSIRSLGSTKDKISVHDLAVAAEKQVEGPDRHEPGVDVRPRTADGKYIDPVDNSSAPSKYSHFAFSGPLPGIRATSWGDDEVLPKEPQLPKLPRLSVPENVQDGHEQEVEHEISILEGRLSPTPNKQSKGRQARVVTVAFSSPLVEQREPANEHDEGFDLCEGDSQWALAESPPRSGTQRKLFSSRRTSFGMTPRSAVRNASRRQSISNQSYIARPMSRLDEQDEMSLVHCSVGNRHMSMELAISTPMPMSRSLVVPPTTGQRSSTGFFLSPLPDFTVNQVDRPIDPDLKYVARRRDGMPKSADNQLSLAAQDLVKNLTDIEPYEPYWDDIRIVDLRDRHLRTLHMLDEFCGRAEELDVSNNQVCELNGIPRSVRLLNIRGNCLSDLAAWHSLHNLQYLDVSDNQLSSLKGFNCLVHLRALKADNNQMESLEGVEDLDGLTSLSLQGNKLRAVDFRSYNM